MDDFLKTVTTQNFWVSVVLVGILINIISHHLIPILGRLGAGLSSSWQKRSVASLARRAALLKKLHDEDQERNYYLAVAVEDKLSSIQFLIVGAITLMLSLYFADKYPAFASPKFSFSMEAMEVKIFALELIGALALTISMQKYFESASKFSLVRFAMTLPKSP